MTGEPGDAPREGANKGPDAFRTISEVAEELGLPQHVLRFWETRFPQIKPIKRGGGRRYYRPNDVDLLRGVKELLYGEGYTIRGVQRILREQGGRKLATSAGASAHGAPRDEIGPDDQAPDVEDIRAGLMAGSSGPEIWAPRGRRVAEPPRDPVARQPTYHEHQTGGPEPQPIQSAEPPRREEPPVGRLSKDQAGRLASALSELADCRRLLDKR